MNTLIKRSISGLIYGVLLIGCIFWCKYSFLAIMIFMCVVMMQEFMRMTTGREYMFSQILTMFTGATFFALVWAVRAFTTVHAVFAFLALIPLFVVMVNSLYVKDKSEFGKFANMYTALLYIAIPFTICNFIVMDRDGNYNGLLLLLFFLIIWASDVGAYIFGMALGQKFGGKLFPSISPKKSWIGFWGGMLLAVVVSVVMQVTGAWEYAGLDNFPWYHAVGLAIAMNISGVYGDLFESQWKRHYEVKDSGNIIPGHGGLLDRLDSTLFAVPIGMIYLAFFKIFELTL